MRSISFILVAALMLVLTIVRDTESKRMTLEEVKNTVKNLRKSCAKKTDAPKSLLDGQHKGEFPPDERLMCYMKCILTTTKTIKNDEVQYEWFIKNARLMLEEQYIPRVEHVVEVCRDKVTATEGCEVAYQFGTCVWETDSEVIRTGSLDVLENRPKPQSALHCSLNGSRTVNSRSRYQDGGHSGHRHRHRQHRYRPTIEK